ncbi:cell division protein SepF [Microcoleus sp. FACHB-1515]|uniref:cell division protein SepF n=1 Tax=Cyanophyceae TaxID=3028117 RepID=UPI00168229DA|nr:cell division protein SepF [Microcoleus sp. FACHB-1515]MBD2090440.1 cell division protein SepF [Microcoleus sp. FACHB-1515]
MSIFQRIWDAIGFNESADDFEYEDDSHSTSEWTEPSRPNNVVGMQTWGNLHSEMIVVEPRSFEEIPPVVTALKERKSVILNLNLMDADTAQRCVDFVAGGAYAIDGHQERIGETVFLFTPNFVQINSLATPPAPAPAAPPAPDAALPSRRVQPNPTRSLKSLVQDLPDVQ